MSDCNSWPLDVSNNLSGYFISNSVLVTSCVNDGGVHLPSIYVYALYEIKQVNWFSVPVCKASMIDRQGVHLPLALIDNTEQWRVHSVLWQFRPEGSICLWYLYVYICTGISLYFLIIWLFWMGSHWWHWTVKSSLCALAVSNGGSIVSFTQVKLKFPYIFLLVDCFEWALIDNIEQQRVHSVLWQFWMGGLS